MLPVLDGLEVCRIIRQETSAPIIILTAKGEEVDRVVGLELGADDYVVKPFSTRELLARIKAVRRRSRKGGDGLPVTDTATVLSAGDLEINLTSHTANLGDQALALKPKEFSLLALLMSGRSRVFTGTRSWSAFGASIGLATIARSTSTCGDCARRSKRTPAIRPA